MGTLLKALIATACMVIIAGGGYMAWREYQRLEQQKLTDNFNKCRTDANKLIDFALGRKGQHYPSKEVMTSGVRDCLDGYKRTVYAEKIRQDLLSVGVDIEK